MTASAVDPVSDKFARMQREIAATDTLSDAAANVAATATHPLWLGLQVALALGVVLVLAVLTIRLLKRLQGGMLRGPTGISGDLIEVVETCHLGPGQKIVALRMGDRIGMIGATKEGMQLLHLLDQPADAWLAGKQTNSQAFSDNLNRLMDRFKKPKKVSEMLDEP